MGILLSCFQIPVHNDESEDVPRRITALTNPMKNNFCPKFEQLFQNLQREEEIPTFSNEEDVCPTCFYEYNEENPKIILQCGHIFHLACIYEWMERSKACPFCSKTMLFLKDEEITEQGE